MALSKVRVQLLNEKTGEVIEEVDVLTSPDSVLFADGKTLTQVLEEIETTPGEKGDKGTSLRNQRGMGTEYSLCRKSAVY